MALYIDMFFSYVDILKFYEHIGCCEISGINHVAYKHQ